MAMRQQQPSDRHHEDVLPRTLEELQAPDERTQCFTPMGLGVTHILTPEAAVTYQHGLMSGIVLAGDVPQDTRRAFDQVRKAFIHGVLNYDSFTLAEDRARLMIELALRGRFVAYYQNGVQFVNKNGDGRSTKAESFEDIKYFIDGLRKDRDAKWKLRLPKSGELLSFDGMLNDLWLWARKERLLPGQWARKIQPAQATLRNIVAHPTRYQLSTPVEAARVIRDVAEIINCLWGVRTPGGRLHPAPIHRTAFAISWNQAGSSREISLADALPPTHLDGEVTTILVLAAAHDTDDLCQFDAPFETTRYPTELLWGPGTPAEALAWLTEHHPVDDEIDHLDRDFLIRYHDGQVDPPRRPPIAAGLPPQQLVGTWYLVRADEPLSAYNHARQTIAGETKCPRRGPCRECAAETLRIGTWQQITRHLWPTGARPDPIQVEDVRVPSILPRWGT
jgi:hypothetical protein